MKWHSRHDRAIPILLHPLERLLWRNIMPLEPKWASLGTYLPKLRSLKWVRRVSCALLSVHSFAGNVSLRWMIETPGDNALGEPILTAVRKHLSWHFSRAPLRIYVHEPHGRDCRSCSQVRNFCATRYKDAQWPATMATTGELSDRRMELFTSNEIRSIRVIDIQIVSLNGMGNPNLTLELLRYISQIFWTRLSDLTKLYKEYKIIYRNIYFYIYVLKFFNFVSFNRVRNLNFT